MLKRPLTCATLLFAGAAGAAQPNLPGAGVTNLVQPLAQSSAKLSFGDGHIVNNKAEKFPTLPNVPGPPSAWTVGQWNHDNYLKPDLLAVVPSAGGPVYKFQAPDNASSLIIRHEQSEPGYVFSLFNSDGTLSHGGGRALYLAIDVPPGVNSNLDHQTNVTIDVRVGLAKIEYERPDAQKTGAVLAMSYVGGGFMFTDPTTKAKHFVFFQITLTKSLPEHGPGYMCAKQDVSLYGAPAPPGEALPFITETGPLHHFRYSLSDTLKTMLSKPAPCGKPWTEHQLDPANWRFTGTYIGSETENTDMRPGAATTAPQGHAALDLDIANVSIVRR